jgi:hypothetical protein
MFGQHPLDRLKALRRVRVLRHVCPRIVFEAGWVMEVEAHIAPATAKGQMRSKEGSSVVLLAGGSLNFVALWDQPHATLSVIERKSS